ncbi:MAG: MFS transporter, partial [Dehalococcoidia bacterium]
ARKTSVSSPPKPKPRFFYGWAIVAVMGVIGGVTLSMGGANFGFFVSPMQEDLGFDLSFFGWANTCRLVGGAVGGVIIGRLLDAHSPRLLVAMLIGLGTLLVVAMGQIGAEWQMLLIFGVLGLLGMQGAANLYTAPVVSKWFVRKRSRAMAFMYVGIPITLIISFPLTQWLIENLGWRGAWVALGAIGFIATVPLSLMLLRRTPEDIGLLPDGDPAPEPHGAGENGPSGDETERSWTRAEALRSFAFWRITTIFGLHMMGQGSVALFRFAHYEDRGIDPSVVSYAASLEGISSIAAAGMAGFLLIRMRVQWLVAAGMGLMALSHTLTILAANAWYVAGATTAFGLGVTFVVLGQNIVFPAFFGRHHIGAIRGVSWGVTLLLAAASAPLTGYVAGATGSYAVIWWPVVIMLVITGIIMAFTRPPTVPAPMAPQRRDG